MTKEIFDGNHSFTMDTNIQ